MKRSSASGYDTLTDADGGSARPSGFACVLLWMFTKRWCSVSDCYGRLERGFQKTLGCCVSCFSSNYWANLQNSGY